MTLTFRASQIETNKIISSGSTGTPTGAKLLIYPHDADDTTAPNQGYINQAVFNTGSIGTDIFLYVSGGIGERNVGSAQSITCFGGDVHISGNLTVDGTSPSGGGGSNFFWSPVNNFIEASGSLTVTGSGYFKQGISGSLQQLAPGVPYMLSGPNVTITTNSLGQLEITSSFSNFFWSPLNSYIETSGSLTITGSGYFKKGISGSLQQISPGVPYLLAGTNITLTTNSLGQIEITGSAPAASIGTLQQTYNAGVATIGVNDATGSLVLSGGISPVGFNFPPLLRLEPGKNGPYASNFSAIDIYGYSGASSASLVNIGTANTTAGSAQLTMRSTGDFTSKIAWKNGAGELYGTTGDAQIYYHPNENSLYFYIASSGKKTAILDGSGNSGTRTIAEFINAETSFGGKRHLFNGTNVSNAKLYNSGSFEQSGSSSFKNNVTITGSLSVSGSGGSAGTLNQYNGLRYYPKMVTSLPYTASLNDYIIAVSASAGAGIELPASEYGRTFIVKDVSGSAGSDNINITAAGGQQIDGSSNYTIAIDYGSAKFVYFGSGIGWGVV